MRIYRAFTKVADGVRPIAPKPTPTAKPSVHTQYTSTEKGINFIARTWSLQFLDTASWEENVC